MTADVIEFGGITTLNLPTERVLENAKEHLPETAVVIGWDENDELYFASSVADGGDVLWLLEKAKLALLSAGED